MVMAIIVVACESEQNGAGTAEALEGRWKVDETSEIYKSTASVYYANISIAPNDSSRIIISNFYNLGSGNEVIGIVEGNRIELVANQEYTHLSSTYIFKNGTGRIATDYQSIQWEYTVDDQSGILDHVTATYTRD